MPSTPTDRLSGLTTSVAVKGPCRTVSTSNITLSGLQTVGSVTVVENDRVLVKGQTDQTENGIYNASTGSWTRAKDFDGNRDVVQGTIVPVVNGASGANLYEVTAANPITIGTTSITFSLRYGANIRYDITEAETSALVTPTDYAYPPLHAFRYMTSAQVADVLTRAATLDVGPAIRDLVAVAQASGGTGYCPAGSYLIRRVAGGDSQWNGIHIPYTHVFNYPQHAVLQGDGTSTVFLAGDNNMTVFRLSDSRNVLRFFDIDGNSKTGVTGLSLIGSDTSNAALAEHIDWNLVSFVNINGCAEGLELESPSAGGCYYNRFEYMRMYNNTRHIRLRDNADASGTNRNLFFGVQMNGGNCGVDIDGADTCTFMFCTFETIADGTSPLATPTAFRTNSVGSLSGALTSNHTLIGCYAEGCTLDLDCGNRRITILGGNMGGQSVSKIVGAATPDSTIGGDYPYTLRSLILGGRVQSDGLGMAPRAGALTDFSMPSVTTSSNQSGAFPFNADGHLIMKARSAAGACLVWASGATPAVRGHIDDLGNFVIGNAAIATNATDGFAYVPGCAGTPTGTPTAKTGRVPIVVDTTANKLYFYSSGAWRDAGP
jgi:hypothetical protein